MIVQNDWKMYIPYSQGSEVINALYDLNNDPREINNFDWQES